MKKTFTLFLVIVFSMLVLHSQEAPPQAFSFKALITKNGSAVVNKTVYLQISILQDNMNGQAVYVETFSPTTNVYGQVDLQIGRGTVVSGYFSDIEWSKDEYFLKVEFSLKSKDPYQTLSTTQLLSVPYALYADKAENGFISFWNYNDIRPTLARNGDILAKGTLNIVPQAYNHGEVDLGLIAQGISVFGSGRNPWGAHIVLDATSQKKGKAYKILSLSDDAGEEFNGFLISNGRHAFFAMDSTGKVGIGSRIIPGKGTQPMHPAFKLDVAGDINFTGTLYQNGSPFPGGNSTHYIGESFGGGIIFYVYDNGQHGLIASTVDQATSIVWDNIPPYTNTHARADGIGAGKANTVIIIASQGASQEKSFAATICNEYSITVDGVTYGDWYLPSKYELNLLYQQKDVVGSFSSTHYWSSTEDYQGDAWKQEFSNGMQDHIAKIALNNVRAVRAF